MRRDETEIGLASLSLALPVEPGDHVVEVSAPWHETTRKAITLREGQSVTVVAEVGAPLARDPSKAPERSAGSGKPLPFLAVGLTSVVVGGASFGASVLFGLVALDVKSTLRKACFPANVCRNAGADAAERGRTAATVATITGSPIVVATWRARRPPRLLPRGRAAPMRYRSTSARRASTRPARSSVASWTKRPTSTRECSSPTSTAAAA